MLTIEAPELEKRLRAAAALRGLQAEDFAARLLQDFLQSGDAIDEATGALSNVQWSSDDLHAERRRERDLDEAKLARRFGEV